MAVRAVIPARRRRTDLFVQSESFTQMNGSAMVFRPAFSGGSFRSFPEIAQYCEHALLFRGGGSFEHRRGWQPRQNIVDGFGATDSAS